MNITKLNYQLYRNMKPVLFHCFSKKQDIEKLLPEFLRGFYAYGYNVDEDQFLVKKQCKNGPIYISISVINLGHCYSNVKIKTFYGNQKDIEKEIKQLHNKIMEYSELLDEIDV
jgi:hypothetical protein